MKWHVQEKFLPHIVSQCIVTIVTSEVKIV